MIRSKHVVYCFRTFALVIRCADTHDSSWFDKYICY